MTVKILDTLTNVKTKVTGFVSEKVPKACLVVTTGMLSVGSMVIPASAEEAGGSSFDTVITYAGKALDFCTSNSTMSTIFYCSMAGAVFYVIRCARKAVR